MKSKLPAVFRTTTRFYDSDDPVEVARWLWEVGPVSAQWQNKPHRLLYDALGLYVDHAIGLAITQFFADVARWECDAFNGEIADACADQCRFVRAKATAIHRRAQKAEKALAKAEKASLREALDRVRMTDIVCAAWDALPSDIRLEVAGLREEDGFTWECHRNRDLVRGVEMLAERAKR